MGEIVDHKTCLIKATDSSQIFLEEFESFCRAFQVPASLFGLYPVARRLMDLLPLMHEQDVPRKEISRYLRIAEAIADVPDIGIEGFRTQPDKGHPGAFHGLYASNPLYCLFVHACSNQLLRKQYAVFMATFIPAYWAWELKTHDRQYLRESAGRAVRRMGDFAYRPKSGDGNKVYLPVLETCLRWLPTKATCVTEYAVCLGRVIKDTENLGGGEIESNTLLFLHQVFLNVVPGTKEADQQRKLVNLDGGGGGAGIVGDFLPALPMVITSSMGGEDEVYVAQQDMHLPGEVKNLSVQQKSPPHVELIVRPRVPVYSTRDDYLTILANKHRGETLALDNQMFIFSNDMLGPFDVKCLLVDLESKTKSGVVDDVVTYLLLAVYVGLSRAEIVRLRAVKAKKVDLAIGPVLNIKQRCVQVRTLSAQRHMRLSKAQQCNRRDHASDFDIRLPRAVIELLVRFYETNGIDGDGVLFREHVETLRKAKSLLDEINSRCGTRLTLNRVEAIRYVLMANFEDEAAAILCTGRTLDRGYEPATYSAWTHASLDALSIRTTNQLSDLAGLSAQVWRLTALKDPETSLTSGSRLAPTQAAMKTFVANQKERVGQACMGGRGLLDLVAMHNAFVSYAYASLVVGMGMRDVSQPFPHSAFLDDGGWALLSDKDNDTYFHTRLVCLPSVISQQLKELRIHCQLLAQRLPLLAWNEAIQLMRSPSPGMTRKRSKNLQVTIADPRLFYSLDPKGQRTSLSPSLALSGLLELGLETNSGRHFLRTYLREHGCPDILVRALLGHWRMGEEVYGRYSTCDPLDLQYAVNQWVDPLMKQLGWTLVRSPLWRS